MSDGTTTQSLRSRRISAKQPNLSLSVETSGCRFFFVLFGVQAHSLFRPIFHCQVESALGLLRLSGGDCVQQNPMVLKILCQIKSRLHSDADCTEPEKRNNHAAQAFDQAVIVSGFPHGNMPTQVAADIFLKVFGAR